MTLTAPFPYFGGKRRAAPLIWDALGDPGGYVEPFAGSAAVLLARPPITGRRVETINDSDGWLINAWRAIRMTPAAVAEHAFGPVAEIDYHARLAWLQERRTPELVSWLEGDPEAHDAKAAGWWLYVAACGIGDPWGGGPWRVVDGHLVDSRRGAGRASGAASSRQRGAGDGVNRELPHLGDAGRGVHRALPHLGDAGQGVHRALPHLGNAGQGRLDALTAYMQTLADRLSTVRITCGSWERVVKPSVLRATAGGDGTIGVFLDPPYATSGDLYAGTDDLDVATAAREWAAAQTGYRIILCGYEDEHDSLLSRGWSKVDGRAGGGAGYSTDRAAGRRERLWLSPECIGSRAEALFEFGGDVA